MVLLHPGCRVQLRLNLLGMSLRFEHKFRLMAVLAFGQRTKHLAIRWEPNIMYNSGDTTTVTRGSFLLSVVDEIARGHYDQQLYTCKAWEQQSFQRSSPKHLKPFPTCHAGNKPLSQGSPNYDPQAVAELHVP